MAYSHVKDKDKDIPSNMPPPKKPTVVHMPLLKDSKAWKEMDARIDATLGLKVTAPDPRVETPVAVLAQKPSIETTSKITDSIPDEVISINSVDALPERPPPAKAGIQQECTSQV